MPDPVFLWMEDSPTSITIKILFGVGEVLDLHKANHKNGQKKLIKQVKITIFILNVLNK